MVSDERRLRAEIEDELKELRIEKEAIHSALLLVASEDTMPEPRSHEAAASADDPVIPVEALGSSPLSSRSRTSSQIGIKSRPQSLELALLSPLPASPAPYSQEFPVWHDESTLKEIPFEGNDPLSASTIPSPMVDSHSTPRFQPSVSDDPFIGTSPWADAISSSTQETEPVVLAH